MKYIVYIGLLFLLGGCCGQKQVRWHNPKTEKCVPRDRCEVCCDEDRPQDCKEALKRKSTVIYMNI